MRKFNWDKCKVPHLGRASPSSGTGQAPPACGAALWERPWRSCWAKRAWHRRKTGSREPTSTLSCRNGGRTRTSRKGIITLYSALVTSHLDTLPSLGHSDAGKTSINWREFRGSHHDGGVWSTCPVSRGWGSSACSPWSSNGFRDLTEASRACSKVTELTELGSSQSSAGQQGETQWA